MSGLRLFNYHPALYWGNYGYAGLPSVFSIDAVWRIRKPTIRSASTTIAGRHFITTGVLGVAYRQCGHAGAGAFPNWITLPGGPGLGLARDWHFALAWLFVLNGVAYLLFGLLSGHFRRDLVPAGSELRRSPARERNPRTICGCGVRAAMRHATTMCCRSSPTLS